MEQIARPVQWTRCMQAMIHAGAVQFVECGAGKVLAGLIKRIDRKMPVHNIESPEALQAAL
jgi:[acyl-carrier-protein] S-malonyltransferase